MHEVKIEGSMSAGGRINLRRGQGMLEVAALNGVSQGRLHVSSEKIFERNTRMSQADNKSEEDYKERRKS